MIPGLNDANREEAMKHAADLRKFEIGLFWQRSLFFWGFIASAFIAYAAATKSVERDVDLLLAISAFGLVCSIAWTLANRGSKYWQKNWEAKLEDFEQDLGMPLFSWKLGPLPFQWWGAWRYSVSRLAIALSDFTVAIWAFLMIKALPPAPWLHWFYGPIVIPSLTVGYIVCILIWGRSRA